MKKAKLGIIVIVVLVLIGICGYVLIGTQRARQVAKKSPDSLEETTTARAGATPSEEKESKEAPVAQGDRERPGDPEQERPAGSSAPPEVPDDPELPGEKEWEEIILPDGRRVKVPKGTRVDPGRSSPPLQPTGRRNRWAPQPREKGQCTISGVVVDSAGVPVAGAHVCACPPDAPKKEGMVSFANARIIAVASEDGRFNGNIAKGKWQLVANYRNALNGRWGLKVDSGVEIELADKEQKTGLSLPLPFALADMASVSGKVIDSDGNALLGVSVSVDYLRTFTDEEGAYELDAILPGEKTVTARRGYGYKDGEKSLNLKAGDVLTDVDIVLELKEKGEFAVSGIVRDSKGAPIEGILIYLNTRSRTVRRGTTDASGFYEFKSLKENKADIQASGFRKGFEDQVKKDVELPAQGVDFTLLRKVRIEVKIADSVTGDPVKQFNLRCYRVDDSGNKRHFSSQSRFSEQGETVVSTTPGNILIEVESPGYEKGEFELTIPDESSWETTLRLTESPEEPEDK